MEPIKPLISTRAIGKDRTSSRARSIRYFGVFFVLGAVIASLGPTLPYLGDQVDASLSQIGALISIRSSGYLVGALIIGRFYDRIAGHHLLTAMLLLTGILMAFVPLNSSLLLLFVLLFLIGTSLGGMDVGSNTLMAWTHGAGSSPYLNAMYFFAGFGSFITPLIIAWLSQYGLSLHWVYWIIAILTLPVVAGLLMLPSPHPKENEKAETRNKNTDLFMVTFFAVLFFLLVGIEVSYGGWIFTYTLESNLGGETLASLITATFWLAITLGRLVAIPVTARLRPVLVVGIDLTGALLSLGIILLGLGSLWAVRIGTFGLGLSIASLFPTTFSLAERSMAITGRLTGWLWAFGSAGGIVVPWLVGRSIDTVSPAAMMVMLWSGVGLAWLVFAGLLFYTRRVPSAS